MTKGANSTYSAEMRDEMPSVGSQTARSNEVKENLPIKKVAPVDPRPNTVSMSHTRIQATKQAFLGKVNEHMH